MITPVLHRLLVKPRKLEEANQTYKRMKELGLAIPDVTDVKREEKAVEIGTIVSMGDTCFNIYNATILPKVGDLVYYAKYAGKDVVDVDGESYIILNDEDVCGIVTE